MKQTLLIALLATMGVATQAQTQLSNSDFELWRSPNEAMGWNSFASAKTTWLTSFGKPLVKGNTTETEGRTGKAAQIVSSNVMGSKANGNLTTGRINMGSAAPAATSNYNFTDLTSDDHNHPFMGQPDSVSFYATYTPGESSDYHGQATFTLHNRVAYKNPHETEGNVAQYRVAEAIVPIAPTTTWTRFTMPMEYSGVALEEGYMLASFTTNPTPGSSAGDVLRIDDVAFIYNSGLKSLNYAGVSVPSFATENTSYVLAAPYDSTKVEAVANGRAATIKQHYNAEAAMLTIRVEGGNIADQPSNFTEYTIRFVDVPELQPHLAYIIASGDSTLLSFDPKTYDYTLPFSYHRGVVVEATVPDTHTTMAISYNDANKQVAINTYKEGETKAYTIGFTPSINTREITGQLRVILTAANGMVNTSPTITTTVTETSNTNGSINLLLNNFSFGEALVGDIFLPALTANGSQTFTGKRTVRLTSYNEDGTPNMNALGFVLGNMSMTAQVNTTPTHYRADISITTTTHPILSAQFQSIEVVFEADQTTTIGNITTTPTTTDVFTLSGQRIRQGVPIPTATLGLPKGIYLVGGDKVIVR